MSSTKAGVLKATVYTGMPAIDVEMNPADALDIQIQLKGAAAAQVGTTPIRISLDSVNVDLQHNQSFGMVAASTGCISNPGGPGC